MLKNSTELAEPLFIALLDVFFEIPADIFTSLNVFDEPLGESIQEGK